MGLGTLEKKYFDLVDTLTEQDVREVVYAARDKEYMINYLTLMRLSRDKGYNFGDPNLDSVAVKVVSQIRMYGLLSILMRQDHSKNRKETGILWEGEVTDNDGTNQWKFIKDRGDYFYFCDDKNVSGVFPVGLVRDLRARELRVLQERGELIS